MKKYYFFLLFGFFSCEVFAEEELKPGILKQLVEENAEEIQTKESEVFHPKFTNRLVFEVVSNDEYQSTNRQDEFLDTRAKSRLYSSYNFAKYFSVNSFLKTEPSRQISETSRRNSSPNGGGDRAFENEGIFVEELNLTFNSKKHAFVLGKFDLNFGSAWRWNRGIWTYNIAERYKQKEKLGINGIYRIGDSKKNGRYEFTYAAFTNDRKNLDNSAITGRDVDSKSDGVPGDTRSLKSYTTSLDINFDFSEKEKLSYHFSYINLAVNSRASDVTPSYKIARQKCYTAGLSYKYPVFENLLLDSLVEYASIKNLGGDSDIDENYLTANAIAKFYKNWNVTLGYAQVDNSEVQATGFQRNLSEISLGYEFKKNSFFDRLLFQVGYKNQRDDFKTSLETRNVWGGFVRYQKNF